MKESPSTEGRQEVDAKTAIDIELDKVLDIVKGFSLSKAGRDRINPESSTCNRDEIDERYMKIDSYMNYLDEESSLSTFPSIDQVFDFVSNSHGDISGFDIYKVGEFLDSYFKMLSFLHKSDDIHQEDRDLSAEILYSLDSEGDVNENHPRLLPLIKEREDFKAERFRFSSYYINSNKSLVQNTNPVYRNERVVIPLKADQKHTGDIYIMGSSSSGATLFAEPFKLVDLNNKVVIAEEKIRNEKIKIKHDLSEKVRFLVPVLKKMVDEVADFDFHYSFALWAKKSKSEHPELSDTIELVDARHPLLGEKAVPITIKLGSDIRVLVLSGANAGGKTVTMKTVALLATLNQICGFIPARAGSKLPIFDDFFSDIGDGQSISKQFSTFSSHMSNIARIAKNASEKSLVILDELGSGTDPEEGASLSIAILGYMKGHSRLTIATSHYGQVKNYAYSNSEMMNASMEFDDKSSKPTYRILEGIPGDSHAISTAIRADMPKAVIAEAKRLLSSRDETSASIIASLLSKSRTLDRKITQTEVAKRDFLARIERQKENEEKLKSRELELEKIGYKEICDYMADLRKRVEKLIEDVSSGNLTKEKIKKAKSLVHETLEKEVEIKRDIDKKEKRAEDNTKEVKFEIGQEVISKATKTRGKILQRKGKNRYFVSFENGLRMEVDANMLEKAEKEKSEVAHFLSNKKKAQFVIDVRGKTLNESIEIIENQIEAAILENLTSFSIIHGYGDGILQRGINEYLKTRKEVKDVSFARPEDGGMGKTYVTLF